MGLKYSIVGVGDEKVVTVFEDGVDRPLVAHSSQPTWQAIMDAIDGGQETGFEPLFDISAAAQHKFERLSDRVTVANGRLYLDGDEVNDALSKQVVRFLSEEVDDWKPLVSFFEKVQMNPEPHSREQLYAWLARHDFTITPAGDIVAYKGVTGDLRSIRSGPGIVNGEAQNGHLANDPDNVIEMQRSMVHHDPSQGCSTGLHVGTFDYAKSFSQGAVVKVLVHPRDIVSVPTDCGWAKVRCCRYKVVEKIDVPVSTAVSSDAWDDETDDWYGDDCDW
jgi:hypothetical protein